MQTSITLLSPATDFNGLDELWDPLVDIVLSSESALQASFLRDTGLSEDDELTLVLTADCPPTKGRWIARQSFVWRDEHALASTQLEVPGQEIGGFLRLRASVVGDAHTGDPHPKRSRHQSAKLWSSEPIRVSLQQPDRFPASTISFAERNWPEIPWTVRSSDALEPDTHLTAALRLYLNADLPEGRILASGEAGHAIATAVEADVMEDLFDRLSRMERNEVLHAAEDPSSEMSIAAVGHYNAERRLGISLLDALEWAREDPRRLKDIIREKTRFLRGAQA